MVSQVDVNTGCQYRVSCTSQASTPLSLTCSAKHDGTCSRSLRDERCYYEQRVGFGKDGRVYVTLSIALNLSVFVILGTSVILSASVILSTSVILSVVEG